MFHILQLKKNYQHNLTKFYWYFNNNLYFKLKLTQPSKYQSKICKLLCVILKAMLYLNKISNFVFQIKLFTKIFCTVCGQQK